MSIESGQGMLLKAFFANGTECSYPRPFLVIENTGSIIRALNVSSVEGKLHKLSMPSNKRIYNYNPPFLYDSFVKLDEIYNFSYFPGLTKAIVARGRKLNPTSLSTILDHFSGYASEHKIISVSLSVEDIRVRNPHL